jgi:hypothetical protein
MTSLAYQYALIRYPKVCIRLSAASAGASFIKLDRVSKRRIIPSILLYQIIDETAQDTPS